MFMRSISIQNKFFNSLIMICGHVFKTRKYYAKFSVDGNQMACLCICIDEI